MGQINISRIGNLNEVITPPTGVDGLYNNGGLFYVINNTGEYYSLVSGTGVSGVGVAGQDTYWVSSNVLGARASNYSYVGATLSGGTTLQIAHTFSYAPRSFQKNAILQWQVTVNKLQGVVGAQGLTLSLYINKYPDLSGSPQLILERFAAASFNFFNLNRNVWVDTGTQSWCYGNFATSPDEDWDVVTNRWKSLNIDWSVQQYFIITSIGGDGNTIEYSTKLSV